MSTDPLEQLKKGLPQVTPISGTQQNKIPLGFNAPGQIAGVNSPTIGNKISPIKGSESTQFNNFTPDVKSKIATEIQSSNTPKTQQSEQQTKAVGEVSMNSLPTDFSEKEIQFLAKAKAQGLEPQGALDFLNETRKNEAASSLEVPTSAMGGLRGEAARQSPIDLGGQGELAINPIGRVTEILDNAIQNIPTFTGKNMEDKRKQRVSDVTDAERAKYEQKFKSSKFIQGLYGDVDTYIGEAKKTFRDQLFGTGDKGPNVGKMIVNAPASAVKTVSAIGRAITNPADTLAGLGKIIFTAEGRQAIVERYGSRDNFAKTLETDPVGVASDVLTLVEGGASIAKVGLKLAGATEAAAKAGSIAKQAGTASSLGLNKIIPTQLSNLKAATAVGPTATAGAKVLSKAVNYGVAMTKPLDTLINVGKGLKDALPTAEGTLQRMNRLTAGDQRKFFKTTGQPEGKRLNDRGIVGTPTETIEKLADHFTNSKAKVDEGLATIKGTYKNEDLGLMSDDAVRFAENTRSTELKRMTELNNKHNTVGLTMPEINEVKRFFERNNKFTYGRDITAGEKTARATNVDTAVRNRQVDLAEKNGFGNLREMNKETQGAKMIMDALVKNENGKLGNNAVTITDWIVAAPAMLDPHLLAGLVTKKILQSNRFTKNYAKIINKINGHQNIAEKAADLSAISKIQDEKAFQAWLDQGTPDKPMLPLKEGVPASAAGYNAKDVTPITVTPDGKAYRKGQILDTYKPGYAPSNSSSNTNISDLKTLGKVKLKETLPATIDTAKKFFSDHPGKIVEHIEFKSIAEAEQKISAALKKAGYKVEAVPLDSDLEFIKDGTEYSATKGKEAINAYIRTDGNKTIAVFDRTSMDTNGALHNDNFTEVPKELGLNEKPMTVYKGIGAKNKITTPGGNGEVFTTNSEARAGTYTKDGNVDKLTLNVKKEEVKTIKANDLKRNTKVDSKGNVVKGTSLKGKENFIDYNNKLAKKEGFKVVVYKGISDNGPYGRPSKTIGIKADSVVVLDKKVIQKKSLPIKK